MRQAVAVLVVPADQTSTATMEGAGIAGRLVVEASPSVVVVRLVAEAAVRAQVGLEADVQMTTEDLALVAPVALAEGVRETLEAEVAPMARTEEETPLMKVTTTGEGVVAPAPN